MHIYETILAEQPFFKGLELGYLELIGGCASEECFDAGEFIIHQDEDADRFYIICHGRVSLEVFAPERGTITIQTVGEGDVLGASWLFPPYRSHYDARALEFTRVIAFDARCLRGVCEKDHDLGYELMKRFAHIMMQRLKATRLQLLDVYGGPVGGR